LGFVNVYNIGGFFANPGIREVYPAVGVPEPEEVEEPTAPPPPPPAPPAPPVPPTPPAPPTPPTPPAPANEYRTYTVRAGDSLYRIAGRLLGNSSRWGEIFELNRDIITNPRMLRIGWQLRIPAE